MWGRIASHGDLDPVMGACDDGQNTLGLMRPAATVLFALTVLHQAVSAGGPVAPPGWDGSFTPQLPGGQECCMPADLNGTNLLGGAFVLLSNDKKRFAVFALTYTSVSGTPKESWFMLESHSSSDLPRYEVSIVRPSSNASATVRVCEAAASCWVYSWNARAKAFVKSKPRQQ